jgi:hypothetical protein
VGLVLPVPASLRGGRPQAARAGVGLPLALGPAAGGRVTFVGLCTLTALGGLVGWHVRGLHERARLAEREREEVAAMLRRYGA